MSFILKHIWHAVGRGTREGRGEGNVCKRIPHDFENNIGREIIHINKDVWFSKINTKKETTESASFAMFICQTLRQVFFINFPVPFHDHDLLSLTVFVSSLFLLTYE